MKLITIETLGIVIVTVLCMFQPCTAQLFGFTLNERETKTHLVEIDPIEGSMKKLAHFKDDLAVPGVAAADIEHKILYAVTYSENGKNASLVAVDITAHQIVSRIQLPITPVANSSITVSERTGFVYVSGHDATNPEQFKLYEVNTETSNVRAVAQFGKDGDNQFSWGAAYDSLLDTVWVIRVKLVPMDEPTADVVVVLLDSYDIKNENITHEFKPSIGFKLWVDAGAQHGYLKCITFCPPVLGGGHCLGHYNISNGHPYPGNKLDIGALEPTNTGWDEANSVVYIAGQTREAASTDPILLFGVHLEDGKILQQPELCKTKESCPVSMGYFPPA